MLAMAGQTARPHWFKKFEGTRWYRTMGGWHRLKNLNFLFQKSKLHCYDSNIEILLSLSLIFCYLLFCFS